MNYVIGLRTDALIRQRESALTTLSRTKRSEKDFNFITVYKAKLPRFNCKKKKYIADSFYELNCFVEYDWENILKMGNSFLKKKNIINAYFVHFWIVQIL